MPINLTRRTMLQLAGAGAAALTLPAGMAHAATKLRYGNAGNPTSLSNVFNQKLSDAIAAKTKGELSMEIFAGSLGGEQKLLDSMSLGSLDMYNGAYTGTREFDILYSPGFFRDGVHAKAVIDSEIGAKASAVLGDRYGARLLGVGRLGGYNLMLRKPISSLSELKGLKIRSAQIEGCIEGLKHFGAIPTPIPFNEIYLAVQQGIVDGVLTALSPGVAGKFYEVAKYVVEADFGLALDKEAISVASWNALSPDYQQILATTFTEMEETDYYGASIGGKQKDLGIWSGANGADSILKLDAASLAKDLEPLNRRLADEVYGAGAWDKIKAL
ncbi:TRAP transporter substrate-binding protein [Gemmobacter sp.]|uniref:TRAP transporter substrate-binding protein n=1 Tax=Gemmobacter sp. TaxID=1898957 RepID=UPI002AFEF1E0|nr:TRAP transporter substrate-binding protein [Gemmobacter sp.]